MFTLVDEFTTTILEVFMLMLTVKYTVGRLKGYHFGPMFYVTVMGIVIDLSSFELRTT